VRGRERQAWRCTIERTPDTPTCPTSQQRLVGKNARATTRHIFHNADWVDLQVLQRTGRGRVISIRSPSSNLFPGSRACNCEKPWCSERAMVSQNSSSRLAPSIKRRPKQSGLTLHWQMQTRETNQPMRASASVWPDHYHLVQRWAPALTWLCMDLPPRVPERQLRWSRWFSQSGSALPSNPRATVSAISCRC
jgi:hypothetical protein